MAAQTAGKVPAIRFIGFNGDWDGKELGQLFPITSAARVHKSEWTKSGVPFFRSSDVVSYFKGENNTKAFISVELYEELSTKVGRIKKGDILVTGGGSIGIPFLVNNDNPLYFKDADLLWFKIREAADSRYLYTFLSSWSFRQYLKSISHIGTIAHYTVEQAKGTPLALPRDQREQTRIGEYFREVDSLIWLHQRKHDKLMTLKKAMLQQMFPQPGATAPEIRFKGFEGPWTSEVMSNIGQPYTGLTGKSKADFGHGSGRYVTYMGVFGHEISNSCMTGQTPVDKDQNEVKKGDVLFTISSETPNEVGMSSVWMDETENVYLNSFCFGFRPSPKFCSEFLAYLFRADEFRSKVTLLAQGISRYNISKTKAMDIFVSTPEYEEQKKIGSYFRTLDALIAQHATQLQKLQQIKSACLEKMFV